MTTRTTPAARRHLGLLTRQSLRPDGHRARIITFDSPKGAVLMIGLFSPDPAPAPTKDSGWDPARGVPESTVVLTLSDHELDAAHELAEVVEELFTTAGPAAVRSLSTLRGTDSSVSVRDTVDSVLFAYRGTAP